MASFVETINSKEELLEYAKTGYKLFVERKVSKNDFLVFFGMIHARAIREFYPNNNYQVLVDAGFNTGSEAYFSAGINASINLEKSIYELPQYRLSHPIAVRANVPLQQIYYGAPGTGKSFTIDNLTDDDNSIRTTFHPDTDYASFVGAYKPTMKDIPLSAFVGKEVHRAQPQGEHPGTEQRIVYKYVPQAFLKP